MQGYNFTERVRKVLAMSREEAARLNHEYVGTEHILLALIREGGGVATAILQNLDVNLDDTRAAIESVVRPGAGTSVGGPDLPYTSRAKKVLELAMAEARDLGHSYVGTEHLLLGLSREERGIAAQLLDNVGATIAILRSETLRVLSTEVPSTQSRFLDNPRPTARNPLTASRHVVAVTLAVRYNDGEVVEQHFRTAMEAIRYLARP